MHNFGWIGPVIRIKKGSDQICLNIALMPAPRRFDIPHDAMHVGRDAALHETAGQYGFRAELAGGVKLPDFPAIVGGQKFGRETAEVGGHVCDVPLEQAGCVVVSRGIKGLGQIDDDQPVAADEHVVLGQVAVYESGAEHENYLCDQRAVVFTGLRPGQLDIVESRRVVAVIIDHQFHQQYSPDVAENLRHAHSSGGKAVQGVYLGVLPSPFLLLPAIFGVLLYGARLAAVLPLAAFLVLGLLAEAPVVGVLVYLGTAELSHGADDIDFGFLAAHKLADDLVDEAVMD